MRPVCARWRIGRSLARHARLLIASALVATVAGAVAARSPAAAGSGSLDGLPPASGARGAKPSTWDAEWTLLVFAANDDRDRDLVAAYDQDADEWQRELGGSALFRILVERDYAGFQAGPDGAPGRPSELYTLYRERRYDPETLREERPELGQGGTRVLGETDTSDPGTLKAFLTYGIRRFPAKHYWLVVTGHGDGWNGLAYDASTGLGGRQLSLDDLRGALIAGAEVIRDEIRTRPGLGGPGTSDRIDVAQFDVCRFASVEVAASLVEGVDRLVATRENMPDAGHPYGALRFVSQDRPAIDPETLVSDIITDYVRAYVDGVSTEDRAYVGTSVTSVGLDLRRLDQLIHGLSRLGQAIRAERPGGFTCGEVQALGGLAAARARLMRQAGGWERDARGGGAFAARVLAEGARSSRASRSAVDLIALLGALAEPARKGESGALSLFVSREVSEAARAVLALIGRPHLWTEDEPFGIPLRFGGQYREIEGFNLSGPFLIEAQRIVPESSSQLGGLSVFWGDPMELLYGEPTAAGGSRLDVYRALPFEQSTGWTGNFEACIEQMRACLTWAPDPAAPMAPNPCDLSAR